MKAKGRLSLIAAAGLALVFAGAAHAEFVPKKPVEIIVHAGPGGGNDIFGRAMISIMEKEGLIPVRFQIINKSGGGSANARNFLGEKKGDDYTIGLYSSTYLIDPLVQEVKTTTMEELTPIANLVYEPALIVVRADSPFKTLKDFIEAAKAEPKKYKQSAGNPLAREAIVRHLLMAKTGADWAYVSYPSAGERISALLGGHTDLMMIEPSEEAGLVTGGKLRALAQIANKRLPAFPDVPTLTEAGYEITSVPQVRGVIGPPGMSADAKAYYSDLFAKLAKSDGWKDYLKKTQLEDGYMNSEELAKFEKAYVAKMRDILVQAGMKVNP
ncbi:tripartite tricarboxylate transporter substrate binding protein [Ancylobacter sp. MQZ15Z-1]|uniref:Tripartite tricarboxylate transporter substrate binding protein n=1 Tax=Ancylobacter mangrovi TaxID=2972472 RepID=A0A9X2PLD2_9HYPH|nr:tripartite tricarboxylate transporter substrate binding protein [Ancylobacter mangrovi]MCS0497192.1 tripartite tricarboxylate transporter substrate binding protein [Ancylobacter mangrovi]